MRWVRFSSVIKHNLACEQLLNCLGFAWTAMPRVISQSLLRAGLIREHVRGMRWGNETCTFKPSNSQQVIHLITELNQLNPAIEFDWVWLPNVWLTTPCRFFVLDIRKFKKDKWLHTDPPGNNTLLNCIHKSREEFSHHKPLRLVIVLILFLSLTNSKFKNLDSFTKCHIDSLSYTFCLSRIQIHKLHRILYVIIN